MSNFILLSAYDELPIQAFLDTMAALTSTPLSDFSKNWTFLPQEMQPLEAKSTSGSRDDAREQVEVPGGTFDFQVKGGNSMAFNK